MRVWEVATGRHQRQRLAVLGGQIPSVGTIAAGARSVGIPSVGTIEPIVGSAGALCGINCGNCGNGLKSCGNKARRGIWPPQSVPGSPQGVALLGLFEALGRSEIECLSGFCAGLWRRLHGRVEKPSLF